MKHICILLLFICHLATGQTFNITSFGATGDSLTLNTTAIQKAIDSCNAAGGGTVQIPVGIFLTGTLIMKSNVNLHIDSGGTLKGSSNAADYPTITPGLRNYTDNYTQHALIYAENARNISFTGKGKLNGNGTATTFLNSSNRAFGFRIYSCSNVRYDSLTLINSGFWMMHNMNIDTLHISNLRIINHCFGNQDGVNVDGCRKVLVEHCFMDCNDDPLVLKTSAPIWCQDVEIRNCTVATYSRAIKIGTETHGYFKNIWIHDCIVQKSTLGVLNSDASCGLMLAIVDGGSMEDVLAEHITMTGVSTPIVVRLGNRARKHTPGVPTPPVGTMKSIRLKDITAVASSNITSSITGIPGHEIYTIRLKNIHQTVPGGMPATAWTVPENETATPDNDLFGDSLPAYGLYTRHIRGLGLCNVQTDTLQYDGRYDGITDDVMGQFGCEGDVGIAAVEADRLLQIYPNPASAFITIALYNGGLLQVFNQLGAQVFEANRQTSVKVDVSTWAPGLYIARSGGTTTRFVVQH